MPDLLKLPEGAEIRDAHGLELDEDHNIYLTYGNWATATAPNKPNNGTDRNCLIRWDPDGTNAKFMTGGADALCSGLPHGIRLAKEDGKQFFYHANVGGAGPADRKLAKTTLDGTIVWQVNGTFGQPALKSYRPTWFGIPPTGPYVWLVDGCECSDVGLTVVTLQLTGTVAADRRLLQCVPLHPRREVDQEDLGRHGLRARQVPHLPRDDLGPTRRADGCVGSRQPPRGIFFDRPD